MNWYSRKIALLFAAVILISGIGAVLAQGRPWANHAAPFDFLFGNKIDTHQQSQITGNGQLKGFLYISFTGDYQNGSPVAQQMDCSQNPDACSVGWLLDGVPMYATLLQKSPRVWCVNPGDLPRQQGYTHFRWLGSPYAPHNLTVGATYSGFLLKRTAIDTFFWLGGGNEQGHGHSVTPGIDSQTNIVTDCSGGGGGHDGGGDHDDGGCGDDGGCAGGH